MKQNLVEIPDADFRSYLKHEFSKAFIGDLMDANHTDVVNFKYTFSLNFRKIESLEGIEHFPALTILDCSYNILESLNVSKNLALTTLECEDNNLTSLDVSKNVALTTLDCSNNNLESLDVTKNLALEYLDYDEHKFTVDTSNNPLL